MWSQRCRLQPLDHRHLILAASSRADNRPPTPPTRCMPSIEHRAHIVRYRPAHCDAECHGSFERPRPHLPAALLHCHEACRCLHRDPLPPKSTFARLDNFLHRVPDRDAFTAGIGRNPRFDPDVSPPHHAHRHESRTRPGINRQCHSTPHELLAGPRPPNARHMTPAPA